MDDGRVRGTYPHNNQPPPRRIFTEYPATDRHHQPFPNGCILRASSLTGPNRTGHPDSSYPTSGMGTAGSLCNPTSYRPRSHHGRTRWSGCRARSGICDAKPGRKIRQNPAAGLLCPARASYPGRNTPVASPVAISAPIGMVMFFQVGKRLSYWLSCTLIIRWG